LIFLCIRLASAVFRIGQPKVDYGV
jgi:hypothetical protein